MKYQTSSKWNSRNTNKWTTLRYQTVFTYGTSRVLYGIRGNKGPDEETSVAKGLGKGRRVRESENE